MKDKVYLFIKRLLCKHSFDYEYYEVDNKGRSWDIYICSRCGLEHRIKRYKYVVRIVRVENINNHPSKAGYNNSGDVK